MPPHTDVKEKKYIQQRSNKRHAGVFQDGSYESILTLVFSLW